MNSDELVHKYYDTARVARHYGGQSKTMAPEERIFEIYRENIERKRVLDLGCGAGRTTPRLQELSASYVGLDYSEQMVRVCKQRFPGTEFVHGDASEMSFFLKEDFDFVLFSFNGLDSLSHERRLKVLVEVHRVLRPNGVFAFSSHNIDDRNIVVSFDRALGLRPRAVCRNIANCISYWLVRKLQLRTHEYAILSDPRAGFKVLNYYVSKQNQVDQLLATGFTDIVIIDLAGEQVPVDTADHETTWFHYACRKPQA